MNARTLLLAAALAGIGASASAADPIKILFVGDSSTFGRVDPVLGDNAANVHDLTAAFTGTSSAGSNPYEPHRWGGGLAAAQPETWALLGGGLVLVARRRKDVRLRR